MTVITETERALRAEVDKMRIRVSVAAETAAEDDKRIGELQDEVAALTEKLRISETNYLREGLQRIAGESPGVTMVRCLEFAEIGRAEGRAEAESQVAALKAERDLFRAALERIDGNFEDARDVADRALRVAPAALPAPMKEPTPTDTVQPCGGECEKGEEEGCPNRCIRKQGHGGFACFCGDHRPKYRAPAATPEEPTR